jgi:hypothetical protein
MAEAKIALYRLDFCTDLTAVQAPTIALGYMLETAVSGGARFLGLASRVSLTPLERDLVNVETWPEILNLDNYMGELFERAWEFVEGTSNQGQILGSSSLAQNFSSMSALCFASQNVSKELSSMLETETEDEWQTKLYNEVLSYRLLLVPTIKAPIIPLRSAQVTGQNIASLRPKIRAEAA